MATRENQGLQIALILFVMITVALAISTYVYFRAAEEADNEVASMRQQVQTANTARDTVILENQKLKEFIGHAIETPLAEIETAYNADMTQFAADYPPDEPKNYRTLPLHLIQAVQERAAQVADASILEKQLDAQKQAVETREIAKTAEAIKAQEAAIADRDGERQKFNADRGKFTGELDQYAKQLDDAGKQRTAMIAQHQQQLAALTNERDEEARRADALVEKVAVLTKTTFETADGQVTWVNQKSGTVWIDVGLLDGVRPQTSFKVYPPGQNSYEVEASKGTIEVVAILDKHRAEARIINDSTTDPILPGDFIYTPLWRPGTQVRFALAGMIDLDDDGRSDRGLIKSLITMNSGIIDSEVDEEGKRSGRMSVDTRYLVVGKRPTETTDPAAIAGYTNMLTDAQGLGVEQITVDKLLDYLNYRGTERSVRLGKGANPKDFRAEPIEGVNRRSTGNNAFKERRPPAPSNDKGAY